MGNFRTGTHGTRIAEGAESQCHRPNEGQGSPFQVDRKFLSQTALGHSGQMDAVDVKVWQAREPIKSRHV
ncbi:hypothetical protein KI387_020500, partial [Taxus chinensis]